MPACLPDTGGDLRFKVKLVNEMLVDFAASMKLAKPAKDVCPFLQPSTQCQYLRSLLAGMKDDYGWDFTLDSSFNFKGGVKAVLDQLFQKRRKEYGNVSIEGYVFYLFLTVNLIINLFQYGSGEKKAEMSESDFTRLIAGLKKYDEEDLKQHQKKLWVLIGLATGPRGQEQHTFEVHHIEKDVCGPEHPKKV